MALIKREIYEERFTEQNSDETFDMGYYANWMPFIGERCRNDVDGK